MTRFYKITYSGQLVPSRLYRELNYLCTSSAMVLYAYFVHSKHMIILCATKFSIIEKHPNVLIEERDTDQLTAQIIQIHIKPLQLHVSDSLINPFTSYFPIIADGNSILEKESIIELFGSKEEFIWQHQCSFLSLLSPTLIPEL